MNNILSVSNHQIFELKTIPILEYSIFYKQTLDLLKKNNNHCIQYTIFKINQTEHFIIFISECINNQIVTFASPYISNETYPCLSKENMGLFSFEQKLVMYYNVHLQGLEMLEFDYIKNNLLFHIQSEDLHEVGVGPIHAGIIEPGHFRFICNGEDIYNLEIKLNYQHRNVISNFLKIEDNFAKKYLKNHVLAESIASDSTLAHNWAYTSAVEALSNIEVPYNIEIQRTISLEIERIAMHLADCGNMCIGIAYQLGQVVIESLRTLIINTLQLICGNRFGKGLIRIGGTQYPYDENILIAIRKNLTIIQERFNPLMERMLEMPSVMVRLDGIGTVTQDQILQIGASGFVAKSVGLKKDIRHTQPWSVYKNNGFEPITVDSGDLLARFTLRKLEINQSVEIIFSWIDTILNFRENYIKPNFQIQLSPLQAVISMVEGFRGEIAHIITTDDKGNFSNYSIKDVSQQNWLALSLAVRNHEISDFPINNKSFNLSYCGNDL